MRISDWSSDVCSSDLRSRCSSPRTAGGSSSRDSPRTSRCSSNPSVPRRRRSKAAKSRSEERRVGKEVSVRVDLGGSRIIKKKKKKLKNKRQQITLRKTHRNDE